MSEAITGERVAAVVVTYNRKALLRQCLMALQQQTHPLATVIVVDNASSDGTATMLEEEFPTVEVIRLAENQGGAGGFHAGMAEAVQRDVDWIWVMDDDVEPAPDALEQLFRSGLHRKDDTVALASKKVDGSGHEQRSHVGQYNPVRMKKQAVSSKGEKPIQFSSFAGLLIGHHAVEAVGGPERGFFIWGDDVEYSLRLSRVGSLYLIPLSIVVHHNEFAQKRRNARSGFMGWRNRPIEQFWRKYYEIRNPLLILHHHVESPFLRALGYGMGIYRSLRAAAAVVALDSDKTMRLRLIAAALRHGIRGLFGSYLHPEDFPERLHPEALYRI